MTYLGEFDASPGVLPVGSFVTGDWYGVDVAGTLTLHTSSGSSSIYCNIGDELIFQDGLGWWYSPSPTVTGVNASTVAFVPGGGISATNVQSALAELDSEKANSTTSVSMTDSLGAAYVPSGTTAQRPGSVSVGMFRFNQTIDNFEGYRGTGGWSLLGDAGFPSGTRMAFAQAAAPSGWTQDTSDNADNRMLRVVKTAGNGVAGTHSPILNNVVPSHTHGFTTGNVSADHTHYINDPGHSHTYALGQPAIGPGASIGNTLYGNTGPITASTTGVWSAGISANHTHSGGTDNGSSQTNWAPRYIDLIICSKN